MLSPRRRCEHVVAAAPPRPRTIHVVAATPRRPKHRYLASPEARRVGGLRGESLVCYLMRDAPVAAAAVCFHRVRASGDVRTGDCNALNAAKREYLPANRSRAAACGPGRRLLLPVASSRRRLAAASSPRRLAANSSRRLADAGRALDAGTLLGGSRRLSPVAPFRREAWVYMASRCSDLLRALASARTLREVAATRADVVVMLWGALGDAFEAVAAEAAPATRELAVRLVKTTAPLEPGDAMHPTTRQALEASKKYWSLVKLRVFGLSAYDRCVFVDGDVFFTANMDDWFDLPSCSHSTGGGPEAGR